MAHLNICFKLLFLNHEKSNEVPFLNYSPYFRPTSQIMPKLSTMVLTDQSARTALPTARRYELRDAELRGFMLRVSPSGAKAWYVQLDRNHKRKIGDASVLTASVARLRARDLLMRLPQLMPGRRGRERPTLSGFLRDRYEPWKARRSRHGRREVRRLQVALDGLAHLPLDQVSASQVERWRIQRGRQVRPATVRRELESLKAALNRAVEWHLLRDNPVSRVCQKTEPGPDAVRILTDAEYTRLAGSLRDRNDLVSVLVFTALNTGLQRGELFRLRWDQVYLGPEAWLEVKREPGGRSLGRRIPLNSATAARLSHWRAARRTRGMLVFPGPSGRAVTSITAGWKRLMAEARITGFRFRDCRHDFAVRLVRAGTALNCVSELLGHASLSQAARYARFAPGSAREAVQRLECTDMRT